MSKKCTEAENKSPVFVYARSAGDDSADWSVDAQIRRVRRWIENEFDADADVHEFSDNRVSGNSLGEELTVALDQGKACQAFTFVVPAVSRISKNSALSLQIIREVCEAGGRFVSLADSIDIAKSAWSPLETMLDTVNQPRNALDAASTSRGMRSAFERGRCIGRAGLHYRHVLADPADPDGPKVLARREEFADEIREFYERIAAGEALKEVAHWANTLESRLGKTMPWRDIEVKRVASNPRYKGLVTFRGTKSSGTHIGGPEVLERDEPRLQFVTPELWGEANQRIWERPVQQRNDK